MRVVFLRKFFIIALGLVLTVFYIPRLSADENTFDTDDVIEMVTGDIESVPVKNLTRVSVTNPDVVDISDAQSNKILLLAKKAGETVLFIWDDDGKRDIEVRVVNEDLGLVKARVQKILDEANITGLSLEENPDEGKVVISGSIPKDSRNRLETILAPYSDSLLNLTKEEKNEDLVEVDMEVVEISTTLEKELGIEWGSGTNTLPGSTGTPGASNTTTNSVGSSTGAVTLNYNETLPSSNGHISDFFKIGNFTRTSPLQATVNALLQEGKARLVSKPRLVVVSGKQASFLVGGEIPVESTTTNATGGSTTENVTYTQYGVNMSVTPTIREGKIEVILNVDIRDIDASNSSNGNVAFITRTASTNLLMDNKQTIALAGLIKYSDSVQITEVPFLSKIPILGALFRNRSEPADANTEMVIILTPMVVTNKKFAENQIVMPTPDESSAWKEIDAKYKHEPLPSWPLVKEAPVNPKDQPLVLPVMTAYARMVQERISKAIVYPQAATGEGRTWAGTVKLKLHILKDGSLDSEEVIESSGNDILDQDAMQAAKTAAPFDAFKTGMDQEDMIFTIPIVYHRFISGGQAPAQRVIASY